MSQTSDKPHLWERTLLEGEDKERIAFSEWAISQTFKKETDKYFEFGNSEENSAELKKKAKPLLQALGLQVKGLLLARLPGPKPARFTDENNSYIIPLKILGGRPTVSEQLIREGTMVYMKGGYDVLIHPELCFLLVAI